MKTKTITIDVASQLRHQLAMMDIATKIGLPETKLSRKRRAAIEQALLDTPTIKVELQK